MLCSCVEMQSSFFSLLPAGPSHAVLGSSWPPRGCKEAYCSWDPPGDGALGKLTACACMKHALCSDAKPFPSRDNNKGNNKLTSTSVPLPWPAVAFHRSCFTSSLPSLGCAEWQLEITLKDLLQAVMNCLQMGRCPLQSR